MSVDEHKRQAPPHAKCMILTVSDTRTSADDKSGRLIRELLKEARHVVTDYQLVKDEFDKIQTAVMDAVRNPDVDVVLINGGTGISPRDVTYEAVEALLHKELPGFGEIFRYLSYTEDIGSAAILSRAIAGTIEGTAVFSMPGSTGAVRLAMEKIILPELGHIMREIRKGIEPADAD